MRVLRELLLICVCASFPLGFECWGVVFDCIFDCVRFYCSISNEFCNRWCKR